MTDSAARPSLELYQRVNAVAAAHVAELLGLKRARERGKYGCPVHGGSDSLHAYPGEGAGFYCWGACQRAFSNVDLAAAVWSAEPREAVRLLADRLGVMDPGSATRGGDRGLARRLRRAAPQGPRIVRPPERSPQVAALEAEIERLRDDGAAAATPASIYEAILDSLALTDEGAAYLAARGFDRLDAEAYGFRSIDGAAGWQGLVEALAADFLPAELALAGLQTLPWGGRAPALVIPYHHRDQVVALRFRRLDGVDERRYHTLAGTQLAVPFNADALDDVAGEELHVVEGELNAYALSLHGLRAIGLAGAGAWREPWTPLVRDAARLIAWYDADAAGIRGAENLAVALQSTLGGSWLAERARRVVLPHEQDANDLHRSGDLHGIVVAATWRG